MLVVLALLGCRPAGSNEALLAQYDGDKYDTPYVPNYHELDTCLGVEALALAICVEHDERAPSRASVDELMRVLLTEARESGTSKDEAVAIAERIDGELLAAAVGRCFDAGGIIPLGCR